ncbi:MAG: 4-hydroxyphenylpyruvate dioxygenase [Candidatus Kapabacteria bacterium]|nr:4-hydroxyphenylpyruvate dioxygenase [Candidatus Kapabacteria bacterium]
MEMDICYGGIPSRIPNNSMGIRGYDFVEFYVGSAKHVAYWHAKALGLDITAYCGPETGVRDRTSYLLTSPYGMRIVITSALKPDTYDINSFITKHGDGVKRWAVEVVDVTDAFMKALKGGAVPLIKPHKIEDKEGYVEEAAIRLYDSTEIVFINHDNYRGIFKPGFGKPNQNIPFSRHETGLKVIDHIVGNVHINEMDYWAEYINKALDFETFIYYGPGDISTKYSALLSKVVRSKDGKIKNPINEPYEAERLSQIDEYIQQYNGTGIQHIALSTRDIIATVGALRDNGVEFLDAPPHAYYENLSKRDFGLTQNLNDLEKLGILCDVEGTGYLLQIFTKPFSDRPTFFYEIIQRCNGAQGFGQGNFQALFESIERDQDKRGNLTIIENPINVM